jgi:hypothetical protein
MTESGGRRIKRALYVDLNSVRFCDQERVAHFGKMALVNDYVAAHLNGHVEEGDQYLSDEDRVICDREICTEHELTNVSVFRAYITAYLQRRPDLHQEAMTLLVRQLDPGPTGLPLEVYAFTRTTAWEDYGAIRPRSSSIWWRRRPRSISRSSRSRRAAISKHWRRARGAGAGVRPTWSTMTRSPRYTKQRSLPRCAR